MKRTIALFLSLIMALPLCACGGEKPAGDTDKALALSETGETDIASITLDWAEFAIALENTWGDDY